MPDGNCSEGLGTLPYLLIDIAGTTCSRRLAEDCRIGRRLSHVGVESGSGTIRPVGIFAGRQPKPFGAFLTQKRHSGFRLLIAVNP